MDTRTKLLLSEWAYEPDPANLPGGLELLARSETASGYQGYAIGRRDPANQGAFEEVVLVNRGSDVTTGAAHDLHGEVARDLTTAVNLLTGSRRAAHFDDAVAFYRDVERTYGSRSATPVQLTGHSLGGACAYVQLASAASSNQRRLPTVESFAAPDPSGLIAQKFPDLAPESFATAINHVRSNDPLVGPRAILLLPALHHGTETMGDWPSPPLALAPGLPRLGVNHVLPADPADLAHLLRPHDTVSLQKEFEAGETWQVRDGRLDLVRAAANAPLRQAELQSSVASR
ncbi:MAG: hemolysin [Rhodospirillales bacterium]|nr:hemolysin [Rhodospirillales bacterium]